MKRDESLTPPQTPYWAMGLDDLFAKLSTSQAGLSASTAAAKLRANGSSGFGKEHESVHVASLFLRQFLSPIILILIVASTVSLALGQTSDALIIIAIVVASGMLGFWQEWQAASAIQKLLSMVQIKANVLRDNTAGEIPVEQVVAGDVVMLSAGDIIPGDGRILEANDLFVAEASLTGETFPVEKKVATLDADTALALRTNSLFLGTSVVSGTGKMVLAVTGKQTEFGKISQSLRLRAPETEFARGPPAIACARRCSRPSAT